MLERLTDVPGGIEAVKAAGMVSREDYLEVLDPLVEAARKENRRIRLLYQAGPGFRGLTPGAMWEDFKLGLGSARLFEGCAVVTDVRWMRESTRLARFVMPCPVRIFGNDDLSAAIAWLGSLPEGPSISRRLIAESGVLVVEPGERLRVQDFDALKETADAWWDEHGDLPGLVIRARAFPGWENVAALRRHVRFVRDHHRRVKRVALAADSKVAGLVPHLAKRFLRPEVTSFEYDQLDGAIAWAAGSTARSC